MDALTDDLPTTGGGSVAFGRNPNTLYLGLGDPYDQILVGGAMVKSKNGGVTWAPVVELGSAVSVRDVKVDTSTNRDIVLVATDNGLFRSADEGATYAAVATFSGMSCGASRETSAGWLASAQPCPAANVGLSADRRRRCPLGRPRRHLGSDHECGQRLLRNGRTTLGVACRVTPWSTRTRAPSARRR